MSPDVCEVVITADSAEWLAAFTRTLVEERLCACGHHSAAIRSIYRWKGQMEDTTEVRVALHTRADLVPRIVARIKASHPYDVPCVIALPIIGGNPDYLDWVRTQTETASRAPSTQ